MGSSSGKWCFETHPASFALLLGVSLGNHWEIPPFWGRHSFRLAPGPRGSPRKGLDRQGICTCHRGLGAHADPLGAGLSAVSEKDHPICRKFAETNSFFISSFLVLQGIYHYWTYALFSSRGQESKWKVDKQSVEKSGGFTTPRFAQLGIGFVAEFFFCSAGARSRGHPIRQVRLPIPTPKQLDKARTSSICQDETRCPPCPNGVLGKGPFFFEQALVFMGSRDFPGAVSAATSLPRLLTERQDGKAQCDKRFIP